MTQGLLSACERENLGVISRSPWQPPSPTAHLGQVIWTPASTRFPQQPGRHPKIHSTSTLSARAARAGKSHLTCLAPGEQRKPWARKAAHGFKQNVSKSALYPANVTFSTGKGDLHEVCKKTLQGRQGSKRKEEGGRLCAHSPRDFLGLFERLGPCLCDSDSLHLSELCCCPEESPAPAGTNLWAITGTTEKHGSSKSRDI